MAKVIPPIIISLNVNLGNCNPDAILIMVIGIVGKKKPNKTNDDVLFMYPETFIFDTSPTLSNNEMKSNMPAANHMLTEINKSNDNNFLKKTILINTQFTKLSILSFITWVYPTSPSKSAIYPPILKAEYAKTPNATAVGKVNPKATATPARNATVSP